MKQLNQKFKVGKDFTYVSEIVSKEEVETARNKAISLIKKDENNVALRSCWQCNHAHIHFLAGEWGKWVLRCFDCNKWYFDKIDITDYS